MTISSVTTRTLMFSGNEGTQGSAPAPGAISIVASKTVTLTPTDTPDNGNKAPNAEQIANAVDQVNHAFAEKKQNLRASIERDEATGISVVKVTDKDTKELVSQFPSKEVLAIAEAIRQYQEDKGYLVNVNA